VDALSDPHKLPNFPPTFETLTRFFARGGFFLDTREEISKIVSLLRLTLKFMDS
jgi:hypothetical protein